MRHKLWLVIVILLLAAAGLFAFAATGHTYFAALLALIAALIVFYRFAGRVLKIVVTALLAIGVVVFVIIEIPIVKAARTDAPADCDYIVVLGAGLHGDVPSLSLRTRLHAALAWRRGGLRRPGHGRDDDGGRGHADLARSKGRGPLAHHSRGQGHLHDGES